MLTLISTLITFSIVTLLEIYTLWTPLQALRAKTAPPRRAATIFIPRYPTTNLLLPQHPPSTVSAQTRSTLNFHEDKLSLFLEFM